MLEDREDVYIRDSANVEPRLVRFSEEIAGALGLAFQGGYTVPLAATLAQTQFIALFLDQILTAVIFVLALLGAMVMYSLVVGDVEEKTYEYGMLRALGLRSFTLVYLLGVQTLAYMLPGMLLGLAIASCLHLVIRTVLTDLSGAVVPAVMWPSAWIFGVVFGMVVPAVANLVPV